MLFLFHGYEIQSSEELGTWSASNPVFVFQGTGPHSPWQFLFNLFSSLFHVLNACDIIMDLWSTWKNTNVSYILPLSFSHKKEAKLCPYLDIIALLIFMSPKWIIFVVLLWLLKEIEDLIRRNTVIVAGKHILEGMQAIDILSSSRKLSGDPGGKQNRNKDWKTNGWNQRRLQTRK